MSLTTAEARIIISAEGQKATAEFAKTGRAIGGVTTKVEGTTKAIKKQKSALTATKMSWAKLGLAAAGATAAFILAKKALNFAKEGIEIKRVEEKFAALAGQLGVTAGFIERLQDSIGGTVSKLDLMRGATDLMALGLVKSEKELKRLMTVSGELNFNMNQLVLTLTNMTTMRFDALGVSVDGFKGKMKSLEEQGFSTNDAFKEAFLQQAEAQVKKVGTAAKGAEGKMLKLGAAAADLKDKLKVLSAEGLQPIISDLVTFVDWVDAISRESEKLDITRPLEKSKTGFDLLREAMEKTVVEKNKLDRFLAGSPEIMEDYGNSAREASGGLDQGTTATGSFVGQQENLFALAPGVVSGLAGIGGAALGMAGDVDAATGALSRLASELAKGNIYDPLVGYVRPADLQDLPGNIAVTPPGQYNPAADFAPTRTALPGKLRDDPQGLGGLHGLDFIVPPGFSGDTFPIQASSGERVVVETKQQQRQGTSISSFEGATINIHNQEDEGAFLDILKRITRRT